MIERTPPTIRPATSADHPGIWATLEPVIRAGETLALPRDMTREEALAYWFAPGHEVHVAEVDTGEIVGTYFLRPSQRGGGSHVANAAYVTATAGTGRGVARAMGDHSIALARKREYRAMQFDFVIATNGAAVHLWTSLGFEIAGTLPGAFQHPSLGEVDALVMFRRI